MVTIAVLARPLDATVDGGKFTHLALAWGIRRARRLRWLARNLVTMAREFRAEQAERLRAWRARHSQS